MTQVQHTVTIDRPIEEVWDYVMDTRNDPIWQPHVIAVGRNADQPVALGLEIEETVKFLGRTLAVTLKVTEHEPLRHSAIEVTGGPVTGRGSYDLEAVDGGTRFTMTLRCDVHRFFKVTEPVFERAGRRDLMATVATLKDILESRNDSRTLAA